MSYLLFAQGPNGPGPGPGLDASVWWLVALGVAAIVLLVFAYIAFSFLHLWIQSLLAGARVGMMDMVRMKLLKLDYSLIVRQKIALVQAGVKVGTQELESHVLAGGKLQPVVAAV